MNMVKLVFLLRGPLWMQVVEEEKKANELVSQWQAGQLPPKIAGHHPIYGTWGAITSEIVALHTMPVDQQNPNAPGVPR